MELKYLTILIEQPGTSTEPRFNEKDSSRTVRAMFNPARLSISRTVPFQDQRTPQRDNPETQFTGADPSTITIELLFDTYDTEEATKSDVRKLYTDKLLTLTKVHGDLHRPPVARLVWGTQADLFQGLLTQLEMQYTMFMPDGTPVRATARCSFKEWTTNKDDLKRQARQSADVAKVWVVKQGQTLDDIAAREYGDPREWRLIADANRIDDPSVLEIGRRLVLPPQRTPWRKAWAP